MPEYVPTIGLEIHAELKTQTKMFCDSLNNPDEEKPNVNICPVCVGHPGTLPVANKKAIEQVIRMGYALNCEIAKESKFDRKNYFYPDLPKGYQISQYDMPFCGEGYLELPDSKTRIGIERIHLEEDAGRLVHDKAGKHSFVDFNRAGVPLMELVTHPDLHNSHDIRLFAEELRRTLRYLGASDADMEKGQMRVEVNISLAKEGASELGTKVEMKNLNSFRVVEGAVAYEIERQTELLNDGVRVVQETRGWDENKKRTFSQRSKEEAHDYRYFPEPDLPLLIIDKEHGFDTEELKKSLPELPSAKRERLGNTHTLSPAFVELFVEEPRVADFYEEVAKSVSGEHAQELAANYLLNTLRSYMQEEGASIEELSISPAEFASFITLVTEGTVSSTNARAILKEMFVTGKDPGTIIEQGDFAQVSDEGELENFVAEVVAEYTGPVEEYKKGKTQVLQFLVGQIMAKTKGKANPKVVQEMLEKELRN